MTTTQGLTARQARQLADIIFELQRKDIPPSDRIKLALVQAQKMEAEAL